MQKNWALKSELDEQRKYYKGILDFFPEPLYIYHKDEGLQFYNGAASQNFPEATDQSFEAFSKSVLLESDENISLDTEIRNLIIKLSKMNEEKANKLTKKLAIEKVFKYKNEYIKDKEESSSCSGLNSEIDENENEVEILVPRKRKRHRTLLVRISPCKFKTSQLIIIITDMTEKRVFEHTKYAEKLKTMIICTVSHELRNPLNGIFPVLSLVRDHMKKIMLNDTLDKNGFEDLLNQFEKRTLSVESGAYIAIPDSLRMIASECEELLSLAESNALQLLSRINDMLDFSQLETKEFKLEYSTFSLEHLVNELVYIVNPVLSQNKKVVLEVMIHEQLPHSITSDYNRVKQILLKLLMNSVKYTQKGFISINLTKDEQSDNLMWFTVIDSGCGMSEDKIRSLFKLFGRSFSSSSKILPKNILKGSSSYEVMSHMGVPNIAMSINSFSMAANSETETALTGMGLTISQLICKKLGSKIQVKSVLNTGTQFWFALPLDQDKSPRSNRNLPTPINESRGSASRRAHAEGLNNFFFGTDSTTRNRKSSSKRMADRTLLVEEEISPFTNFIPLKHPLIKTHTPIEELKESKEYDISDMIDAREESGNESHLFKMYKRPANTHRFKNSFAESLSPKRLESPKERDLVDAIYDKNYPNSARISPNSHFEGTTKKEAKNKMLFSSPHNKKIQQPTQHSHGKARGHKIGRSMTDENISSSMLSEHNYFYEEEQSHSLTPDILNRSKNLVRYKTLVKKNPSTPVKNIVEHYSSTDVVKSVAFINRQESMKSLCNLCPQVLVVDDNSGNRKILSYLLKKSQIRLEEACNGLEAINTIKSQALKKCKCHFKLIFMDIEMPVMNGEEAIERIRKMETKGSIPKVPIVVVTAYASEKLKERCLELKVEEFVTKPVILAHLKILLDRYRIIPMSKFFPT